MNNALTTITCLPSPAELSNLRRLRLRSIASEPWMKQVVHDMAVLIVEYPDHTLRLASLVAIAGLCVHLGRDPQRHRA
jgi:hypothetical protein